VHLAAALVVISGGARSSAAQTPVTAGYRDFAYGSTPTPSPTGEKAQSKLWWAYGTWWGCLFSPAAGRYHIYRLNPATHGWIDTNVEVDDRPNSKADVLWDQGTDKLYIVSNYFSTSPAASSSSSRWGRLYRFTYLPGEDRYILDSGFPVTVTNGSAEALTIAKDSTGRLWVTWVESGVVKINHSLSNDVVWNTPSDLPVGAAGSTSSDDISGILAFGGGQVGVMWSNQDAKITYFATRRDTDAVTLWQATEDVLPRCSGACSDDHISLKADSTGRVFAVTKTSLTAQGDPLIVLSVRDTLGVWTHETVGQVQDHHTRPVMLVAEDVNQIFVFASQPESGGAIYYKSSPLSNISFPPGLGTLFISSSSDSSVNNATSTKGSVNQTTGIVVLASDPGTRRYLHNELALSGVPSAPVVQSFSPSSGAVGTPVQLTGSGFAGTTAVTFNAVATAFTVDSDSAISTWVPAGAATGRIAVTNAAGTGTSSTDFVVPMDPGGVSLKDITFENGSLIDPATGVDRVNGSVTLESGSPLSGAFSARLANGTGSYLEEDFPDVDNLVVALDIRVDALPSSDMRLVQVLTSGATVGNIVLLRSGALSLQNGTATVGVNSATLTVGQVYRIMLRQQRGTGANAILEASVSLAGQPPGSAFAALFNGTWTWAANRLRVGATKGSGAVTLDGITLIAADPSPTGLQPQ
jgi:hypothetical protein